LFENVNTSEGNWVARLWLLTAFQRTSLGSANGNVVTNDKELHFVCLVWMLGSELFLR
jgi:hypothetical protein